jgi:hypothetical protein
MSFDADATAQRAVHAFGRHECRAFATLNMRRQWWLCYSAAVALGASGRDGPQLPRRCVPSRDDPRRHTPCSKPAEHMNVKQGLGRALVAVLVASTSGARAQAVDEARVTASKDAVVAPYDWRISAVAGAYDDGILLGATARVRAGLIVVGALFEMGGGVLSDNCVTLAGVAGLGPRLSEHVRVELVGVGGYHGYARVGADTFFGDDPGASAELPFAGARAGLSYLFGKRRNRFELGLYGGYDRDLYKKRVEYSYFETPWFGDEPELMTAEQVVGMSRVGMGLELGGTHDWF